MRTEVVGPAIGPRCRRRFDGLAGIGGLVRLIVRRDRTLIGLWLLAVVGVLAGAVSATASTYPTEQARQDRFDQILGVPMFMLFQSRAYGTDLAALAAQQAFAGATLAAALGAVLLIVRHTRGEEQAGRRELLGSSVVGRHAPLAAALAVVLCCGLTTAVIGALALTASGLPRNGSALLGAVVGGAVWVSAGAAALAAQLSSRVGVAVMWAFGGFTGLHYVRGLAHLGGDRLASLAWFTPNGWLEQTRPYAGDRWWPLLLVVASTAVLIWIAALLSGSRDLGAGLRAERAGPATAPPTLRDPIGLAWRLHRPSLLAWAAGMMAIGAAMGGVGSRAMAGYADLAWVREYAAALRIDDPADAFLVYVVFVLVFASAAHAVNAVLRLRGDEASGLAEAILSTSQSRRRWLAGHLSVALLAPALLQTCLGLGLGTGAALAGGDPLGELAGALTLTLPLVPAVWVVVGVTVAAFGLFGGAAVAVGWGAVAVGIVGELAVKAGMPEWLFLAVSPFGHVSPYFQPTPATYAALAGVAGAFIVVGAAALCRRDLIRT